MDEHDFEGGNGNPHLTPELLDAAFQGRLRPARLVSLALRHLTALCPACRAGLAAWQERERPDDPGVYAGAFRAVEVHLARAGGEVTAAIEEAREWLEELRPLAPDERLRRIHRATRRFRGRAFAEALLAAARGCLPGDPEASFQWARVAEEAVLRSPLPDAEGWPLLALARALLGNGRRALGDLAGAEARLASARWLLEAGGGGAADPLVEAEVAALEGVLRKDQRRFAEAAALLQRAAVLYHAAGSDAEAGRELIALSTVHSLEGNLDQAVTLAFQALATIDPAEEPDAYLGARYNLADYLHSAGRTEEALHILTHDLDLYERCRDPAVAVRVRWLQGRLAAALDDPEEAEEALLEVRAYFEAAGQAFNFAAVCLDLALLHLEAGRYPAVAAAAAEAAAYFRSQGVDREVLAGLLLLEEAAREERVTAQQIRWLARRLETARPAPRRPPVEPS